MAYEKLFQKGKIGSVTIRNRVVMTSMGVGLCTRFGEPSEETIRFYEDRARGGVGLILPEFTRVDPLTGGCNPNQLCIGERNNVRAFEKMIDAVHRHGAKMFIQLQHGGREAPPAVNGGRQAMAPSVELNSVAGREVIMPREMTLDDITYVKEKFITAAANAFRAGADGVELHAAHGYLLQQFISPYTNKRTDEYGGSLENRCRLAVEILEGIHDVCGRGSVVGLRINGSDFVENGVDLEQAVLIAKHLDAHGADYLNVSCGVYASAPTMIEPCYYPEGWRKNLAKTIKANVSIPVIAVNTVKHPQTAEALLEEGVSDFVGVSRGHIADPEFCNKTMAGREELIRKCLGCLNCSKSVVADRALHCAVNPVSGRATIYGDDKLVRSGGGRTVAVIGGGPGGMEAALLLKKRGYAPVIFEKDAQLGGSAILASKAPCKGMVAEFIDTMKAQLREYGIDVRLNCAASIDALKELNPYGVVVACGGEQIVPDIPGHDRDNVYSIYDVLLGRVSFSGRNIAVIGGGHVGLEVAHFLCGSNKVTVVEMQDEVGITIYRTAKYKLLSLLEEAGVEILTNHAIAGISDGEIQLRKTDSGEIVSRAADTVVLALGNRPDLAFIAGLEESFDKIAFVGDAVKGGTMADATKSAYDNCWFF